MRVSYILFILILIFSPLLSLGQSLSNDTIPRIAPISYEIEGNQVRFGAQMPLLNQVSGAPKAFYTYYWEFGDGHYSFEQKPTHSYTKNKPYKAKLWATNNYDNGKPPTSKPISIDVTNTTDQTSTETNLSFLEDEDLILKRNRAPIPDQEMVLITSYKNNANYVANGKLYLFYNDRKFKNDNFTIEDTRLHHKERIAPIKGVTLRKPENDQNSLLASSNYNHVENNIRFTQDSTKRKNFPLTLEESKLAYRDYQIIEFDAMKPGEERTIFRTLKTTPEMIKDTSAMVTLRSVYLPDTNYGDHTVKDTEMEIVTSHDPNKMSSNGSLLNYRLARFRRLKFKIRFQNNGEGPANTIKLEIDTPKMFDKSTLKIDDLSPECPICPKEKEVTYSCLDTILKKDKIIFKFNRIYLAGSEQKNVSDKDSTKGFVKYSMKFDKKFHKKKTRSRTAIFFDKNEPILTNYAATRFLPGISIGAKAGYSIVPELDNQEEYFVGATISPYKSYRGYYQAELLFSSSSFDAVKNSEARTLNPNGTQDLILFSEANKYKKLSIYAVPASYRFNFNNFIALGAGLQLKMNLTSTNKQETTGTAFLVTQGGRVDRNPDLDSFSSQELDTNPINIQTGLFVGANFGSVRIGPSIGIRYIYNINDPNSQIQLYGLWKF